MPFKAWFENSDDFSEGVEIVLRKEIEGTKLSHKKAIPFVEDSKLKIAVNPDDGLTKPLLSIVEKFRRSGAEAYKKIPEWAKIGAIDIKAWSEAANYSNEEEFLKLLFSFVEGFVLASYTGKDIEGEKTKLILINSKDNATYKELEKEYSKKLTTLEFVKDIIAKPAEEINTDFFVDFVHENFTDRKVTIIRGEKLLDHNLRLIHAVGRAGKTPPTLIIIEPKGTRSKLAVIGKGVCYDSGGLCIKRCNSMRLMHLDMTGAAITLGLAKLFPDFAFFLPVVENMPDSTAYKAGDVIEAYNGKKVEIVSTDAEGRLILADAIALAQDMGYEKVVDIATLTGASYTALGTYVAAFLANDDELAKFLEKAGGEAAEPVWRLPLVEEYTEFLKTDRADFKNSAGKGEASTIVAALFLKNFIKENSKWLHIDVAGTNFPENTWFYRSKTSPAFGFLLLYEFLKKVKAQ